MTSQNPNIWVSELCARSEIRAAFQRTAVRFYDTTLRDGEQTVGVVLSPQQKLEIARKLDELGINRIEAGFPRVSAALGKWSFLPFGGFLILTVLFTVRYVIETQGKTLDEIQDEIREREREMFVARSRIPIPYDAL